MSDRPTGNGRIPPVHIFRRLWRFIEGQLVEAVPDEDAPCEFNCRVGQCTMGEWQTCENRLQTLARKSNSVQPPNQPGAH